MYKRTKGQCKKTTAVSSTTKDSMDHIMGLVHRQTRPISLVSSPRSRVNELRAIFETEYPTLDFDTYNKRVPTKPTLPTSPEGRVCTAREAQKTG